MDNQWNLPDDTDLAKQVLLNSHENSKLTRELGVLGKFFGSKDSAKINIAGFFIIILTLSGIIFTFCLLRVTVSNQGISILDLWGILSPFITLSLGYIFGKNEK